MTLWKYIRPGDTVTVVDPRGIQRKGKARIVTATHVVLDGGGRYGTPLIADESNVCGIKHWKCRK